MPLPRWLARLLSPVRCPRCRSRRVRMVERWADTGRALHICRRCLYCWFKR